MTNMTDNPIADDEQRDYHFAPAEQEVLFDAYLILYDYGYAHDDLDPLRHLITHTTIYDGYNLVRACERMQET